MAGSFGLQKLSEVVVLLHARDLSELGVDGIIVGGSINIADDTKGDGETVAVAHQGEFQLQGVVLAVSIVNEYVVEGIAVLTDFYDLQAEALLNESEFVVLTEDEFLTVLYVDGILLTAFLVIDGLMAAVIEDDAVLQYLRDAGTLMLVGSLQHFDSTLGIGCHTAGKEVAAGTKAELGRTERILNSAVGA